MVSFCSLISFSTSESMFSDSLKSPSAFLLALSKLSWASCSLPRRSLVAWYFYFEASNRYIFSSRILLMLATWLRLFASSVAKAESWFLKIATSPCRLSFSSSIRARFSLILASCLSSAWISESSYLLLSLSLSSFFFWSSNSAFYLSRCSLA